MADQDQGFRLRRKLALLMASAWVLLWMFLLVEGSLFRIKDWAPWQQLAWIFSGGFSAAVFIVELFRFLLPGASAWPNGRHAFLVQAIGGAIMVLQVAALRAAGVF